MEIRVSFDTLLWLIAAIVISALFAFLAWRFHKESKYFRRPSHNQDTSPVSSRSEERNGSNTSGNNGHAQGALRVNTPRSRADSFSDYSSPAVPYDAQQVSVQHLWGSESPTNPRRRPSTLTRNTAQLAEQTEFHAAIANKEHYKVKNMLMGLPRLARSVDEYNRTPIHIAADIGDMVTLELLIQYNADINALDSRHRTCLHLCSDDTALRYLCDEGADITITDMNGQQPLHAFTLARNVSCVRVLLEYDADPMVIEPNHSRNSLHLAAISGSFEVLSTMILHSRQEVDVNAQDRDGNTPMHLVCRRSVAGSFNNNRGGSSGSNVQLRCAMLLLDKGADIGIQNHLGETALHLLCATAPALAPALSPSGASASSATSPPTDSSADLEALLSVLLELDQADVNCVDNDGCTPLLVACAWEQWNLAKLLLEAGGDLNLQADVESHLLAPWVSKQHAACENNGNSSSNGSSNGNVNSSSNSKQQKSFEALIAGGTVCSSDLLDHRRAVWLFQSIRAAQSPISVYSRQHCMECKEPLSSSSGRVDCKHCCRVICRTCTTRMPRPAIPEYVADVGTTFDGSVRVCLVCYEVLISDFIKTKNAASY